VYFTSYNTQRSQKHHLNKTQTASHSTSCNDFTFEKHENLNEENCKKILNEDFYFHTTDFNQLKVTVDLFTHLQSELKDFQFKEQSSNLHELSKIFVNLLSHTHTQFSFNLSSFNYPNILS
jgi:hypothetical protein